MRKLLVICGPTATGKTTLALHLAKKFDGEVISADSRQVYKHMRIGTGRGNEKILGYDLVNPNEEFSVSQYLDFANKAVQEIYLEGKLPILVGGTGLYIKAVVDGIDTALIPQNKGLREKLFQKNVNELFQILKKIDSGKVDSMNESDKKNPRRLIRAIEIANDRSLIFDKHPQSQYDTLFIGLSAPKETLKERIEKNVDERIKNDFEKEIEYLKKNGFWEGVPRVTLGYKDWPDIERWKLEEFQYAKRQITWFKANKRINWFDITKLGYQEKVEKLVKKWYIKANAKKN